MDKLKLSVDIIIPTYHPNEQFYVLLDKLLHQTVRIAKEAKEQDQINLNKIFIMNTEEQYFNKARYEEVCRGLDLVEVRHITRTEFDHGGTRNYAASLSKADILMFLTQDAMPLDERLIENLVKPLKEERVAVTYARQLANDQAGEIERYTRTFNYPDVNVRKGKEDLERLGIKTYFCSNVCAAYKREVYEKLGGFVTQTIFNEDMIFASKVIQSGYQIEYASNACVIHSHKYTYRQQFTRNFDLGVSQRQYREIFENIKSESEGIALVKKTMKHLIKKKKAYLIPDLVLQSGFKFLGYKAGLRYEKLSKKTRKRFSMNKSYWDKQVN
ncbi:glycosyltransferase [Anaerosporobacter faecicola]|uniref:glycosyltransferase n=1 Tax=Anaerosporobacter faecicola TaxID=2718714 RepID=UPI00143C76E2|nr:glycosyltransferase family 2 protein [Anaerosporobacter faecicola]